MPPRSDRLSEVAALAHDVFISYSTKDKSAADTLCRTLEAHGIPCWIAPRNIAYGSDYGEAIVDGINESRVMVLVFSSHANTSPHIKREVDRAVSKGLTIIPIRIEDVAPTRALEYYISPVHWLDAVAPPLEPHLEALAQKIRVLLDRTDADRPASPAARVPPAPAIQPGPAGQGKPVIPAPVVQAAPVVQPAPVAAVPAPAPRRFGLGSTIGAGVAVVAVVAVLWAQPWNPGGDKARETAARQSPIDEQRRQEAARQAELDAQRQREKQQADDAKRAAEDAAKRAGDAVRRLEEARKADDARRVAEQKRATDLPLPRPVPAPGPGPVARVEPAVAKGMVEQKLRERGLLKQSGADRWGVTVEITGAGVVTLTGVLHNNEQRSESVRLAGDVPGVTEVQQRINVQQSWTVK